MAIYRLTRSERYISLSDGCAAKKDLSARQGYYIQAKDEQEAIAMMRLRLPGEKDFTCGVWHG